MKLFILLLSLTSLVSCSSSDSELDKKYQGCLKMQALINNDPDPLMQIDIDCDDGKKACDANMKSSECQKFLNSITMGK